ncbi:transcriptional adapter 2-beta [Lepeophtheirus salmonis]|uniref:transcriptional adapter 2-beta n=1 Tax=Lepeophtheirus salmonis TaxID=72036 RepID=UPI001AEB1C55|nr:transcriptional adapter 2-beta-like [Lepeophtheirus salmonis]XP_040564591.1 transcriptional adapter 2-beta-like [Lepeophtheirus salmonis]
MNMPGPELNINPKARCHYCTEEIFGSGSGRVLLRCEECPDLDLCPECWASRAELGQHSPSHSYRVYDSGGYPLLGGTWPSRDHLKLLDAVEQFGYGNWEDISRCILNVSPLEAKNEYIKTFVDASIGSKTWSKVIRGQSKDHTLSSSPSNNSIHNNNNIHSHVKSEPPTNLTLHESIMLGFMPQREDYEVEFDNSCESLVSQLGMTTSPMEEDEVEIALKTTHVDIYKYKLMEREKRKRVVREYGLIGHFFKENPVNGDPFKKDRLAASNGSNSFKVRKGGKSGDIFSGRLKVMAEFLGPKDYQAFIANLTKEKELKQQIKDYQKYRKNGIVKMSDSTEFENLRCRHSKKRNDSRKKNGDHDINISTSFVSVEDLNGSSTNNSVISSAKDFYDQKNRSLPDLPGYEILSTNERKLCSSLKLTPAQYISYKTSLLTNYLQKKRGQTFNPLNPLGLDKNNRKIIFNFLMKAGWINAY